MLKHYASRHRFKTRVVQGGAKGVLVVGHKPAKAYVEQQLGRQLHKETKVVKRSGNWLFIEPCKPKE